jgi:hypothetical protein
MEMTLKSIIDKLSSYNLFNYLFPGFVFVILLKESTSYLSCLNFDLSTVIIIYFAGLVISRVGSLVIEGIMLKLSIIKEINTKNLFEKFRDNIKLEIIHEAMNMYRTLASMALILFLLTVLDMGVNKSITLYGMIYSLLEFAVFILFTFAFYKQRGKVLQCL